MIAHLLLLVLYQYLDIRKNHFLIKLNQIIQALHIQNKGLLLTSSPKQDPWLVVCQHTVMSPSVRSTYFTFFLLFGSLIHLGVCCLHYFSGLLSQSLPVMGCWEGSLSREYCSLCWVTVHETSSSYLGVALSLIIFTASVTSLLSVVLWLSVTYFELVAQGSREVIVMVIPNVLYKINSSSFFSNPRMCSCLLTKAFLLDSPWQFYLRVCLVHNTSYVTLHRLKFPFPSIIHRKHFSSHILLTLASALSTTYKLHSLLLITFSYFFF